MKTTEELVEALRHRADEMQSGYIRPNWVGDRELLREAATDIKAMSKLIEAYYIQIRELEQQVGHAAARRIALHAR